MMTEAMMYWITRLDSLRCFLHGFDVMSTALLVIGLAVAGIAAIICFAIICNTVKSPSEVVEMDDDYKIARTVRNYAFKLTLCLVLPLNVVLSLAYALTPTTKEFCAIKVVPAIMNNTKIQEFGGELYKLGVDWLKELRPQDKATSADSAKGLVEPKQ